MSCIGKLVEGMIEIYCPTIGRAHLLVDVGQWVIPQQKLALLSRMNQRIFLLAPADCEGKIIDIKNHNDIVSLAYGEKFLVIENISVEDEKELSSVTIGQSIDAPMDGMFYLSPSPNDPPFITIGDEISPGQTIGLIEVMKCFYPLIYQGQKRVKIVAINVKNASSIAYGDKLIAISD